MINDWHSSITVLPFESTFWIDLIKNKLTPTLWHTSYCHYGSECDCESKWLLSPIFAPTVGSPRHNQMVQGFDAKQNVNLGCQLGMHPCDVFCLFLFFTPIPISHFFPSISANIRILVQKGYRSQTGYAFQTCPSSDKCYSIMSVWGVTTLPVRK